MMPDAVLLKIFGGSDPKKLEAQFNDYEWPFPIEIVYSVPMANNHYWALFVFYREVQDGT